MELSKSTSSLVQEEDMKYFDRGDPTGVDINITGFPVDGQFHTQDLGMVFPTTGNKIAILQCNIMAHHNSGQNEGIDITIVKTGDSNGINAIRFSTILPSGMYEQLGRSSEVLFLGSIRQRQRRNNCPHRYKNTGTCNGLSLSVE